MSPEAFRDRLAQWRATSPEDQAAYFASQTPEVYRATLTAIEACPDRGGVLPLSLQPEGCSKCGELSACAAGKGEKPGQVTTRHCYDCRHEMLNMAKLTVV